MLNLPLLVLTSRMHFVYLLTRSDQFSGPQVHLRDLALALEELGQRVTVLVGGTGVFTEELARLGIACRSLHHLVAPIHPWRDILAWLEIRRALDDLRPDLVSTHSSKAGVLGRIAANSLGIPVLHTAHGWAFTRQVSAPVRRLYASLERFAARRCSHVITVSDYDRKVALAERIITPDRITTVNNGVGDSAPGLRADPTAEPPRLIMVARLERQKDHESLLQALNALRERPWQLDLVGDGPARERIVELTRELGLSERVRLLGSRLDVAECLAQAQLFILTSHWEGFPRSILEAMRAALPVVATDLAGIPESVVDGHTGFLVERSGAQELEERLGRLIASPELRLEMGRAGRKRYEESFTLRRMLRATLDVYAGILADHGYDLKDELGTLNRPGSSSSLARACDPEP